MHRTVLLFLPVLLLACTGGKGPIVTVSGKTVYGVMAIEEVQVRAFRETENGWIEQAAVRSGYHGSFVIDLPPGKYRLDAEGRIFSFGEETELAGSREGLEVPFAAKRIDRIRIDLRPVTVRRSSRRIPSSPPRISGRPPRRTRAGG